VRVDVIFELFFILVVCKNTLFRLCVAIGGHGHGYVDFMLVMDARTVVELVYIRMLLAY